MESGNWNTKEIRTRFATIMVHHWSDDYLRQYVTSGASEVEFDATEYVKGTGCCIPQMGEVSYWGRQTLEASGINFLVSGLSGEGTGIANRMKTNWDAPSLGATIVKRFDAGGPSSGDWGHMTGVDSGVFSP